MGWLLPVVICFALLFALSFLPADRSLRQIDEQGLISVCMPESYPPLVTGEPERPGFEVELVREIAERAGWRLRVSSNPYMGRDFNPRAWHINRSICQMVAGGVALSDTTQAFMDTGAPHLETGWAMLSAGPQEAPEEGQTAAFYAGLAGLDRIGLGQYLRGQGTTARIVQSPAALLEALETGEAEIAITEALIAQTLIAERPDLTLTWLPGELGRIPLGFGFWRGDLTLRREVTRLLEEIESDGTFAELASRYSLDQSR
ncbi:amino acid ABC transporter substrate-binding protein [Pseudoroseicyclus sp. CLL3-39]|uniref:Amino acid ABC transporter substrate-binding protein n=1 Tax=Pseudoroseicyclus tamaricis TaxID=2705421 RepID=A0A6B2JIH8_9RHOB|nr:amino acid ABC transporter substrate-binding protein [Pseudoroseicyclus tamaricis]